MNYTYSTILEQYRLFTLFTITFFKILYHCNENIGDSCSKTSTSSFIKIGIFVKDTSLFLSQKAHLRIIYIRTRVIRQYNIIASWKSRSLIHILSYNLCTEYHNLQLTFHRIEPLKDSLLMSNYNCSFVF